MEVSGGLIVPPAELKLPLLSRLSSGPAGKEGGQQVGQAQAWLLDRDTAEACGGGQWLAGCDQALRQGELGGPQWTWARQSGVPQPPWRLMWSSTKPAPKEPKAWESPPW